MNSSLNVRDHVSQPYSTTGNIIVLYILIFKFLERNLEDNNAGASNPKAEQSFRNFENWKTFKISQQASEKE